MLFESESMEQPVAAPLPHPDKSRWSPFPLQPGWLAAILVLATALVYFPAIHAGFILDDDLLLTNNPLVKDPDGWWKFWWTTQTPDYLPVMSDSFWLEWRVFGLNPMGYHVSNIVQHAVSAVLLWLVLRELKVPGAWLAALIFAIHPVNVRSVAWIAERKNTLSMIFYLGTLLAFLKLDSLPNRRFAWVPLALFALALLSKSSTVVLPAVLLLLIWYRRNSIKAADLKAVAPYGLLSIAACVTTIWFQNTKEIAQSHAVPDPLLWRVASSGMAVWFYVGKVLAPLHLAMIYPRWLIDTSSPLSFLPLAGVVVVLALLYRYRNKGTRPAYVASVYFVMTLLPVLGYLNMAFFKSSMVSDHLQYISMIGIVALVAGGIATVFDRVWPVGRCATVIGALVSVSGLAMLSFRQAQLYANRELLAQDTLQTNPASFWAHGEMANAMLHRQDLAGAERELRLVIQLNPKSVAAYNNLGTLYANQQRMPEAVQMYIAAETLSPESVPVHMNLGGIYAKLGYPEAATAEFERVLKFEPGNAQARQSIAEISAATELRQKPIAGRPRK